MLPNRSLFRLERALDMEPSIQPVERPIPVVRPPFRSGLSGDAMFNGTSASPPSQQQSSPPRPGSQFPAPARAAVAASAPGSSQAIPHISSELMLPHATLPLGRHALLEHEDEGTSHLQRAPAARSGPRIWDDTSLALQGPRDEPHAPKPSSAREQGGP